MTLYSRTEAVRRAKASHRNTPGTCQLWTRTQFGAPSAGDRDHDGDADAVDGWLSEPREHRHADRHPPAGVPVSYGGGSHGYGHRAISLGNGMIRSTDAGGRGMVADVSVDWPERHWGLRYLGWSDTMDGQTIPGNPAPPKPAPPKPAPKTRGKSVDEALQLLRGAMGKGDADGPFHGHRGAAIRKAATALDSIEYL